MLNMQLGASQHGSLLAHGSFRGVALALLVVLVASASAACTKGNKNKLLSKVLGSEDETGKRPEEVWLERIGVGAAQTARVCARPATDRVASALCAQPSPRLDGIEALYRALDLTGEERLVASTTHSLSLSARSVNAANPRTFVFVNNVRYAPIPFEKIAAVAFTRGEQFVEMVALDTETYEYNFYLLAFTQQCNTVHCTAKQLLTEQVERDWTSWTLYSDEDLVDTPLDCISCHRPYGPDTHKLLLMRQLPDPWIHWGDFRGVYEGADCSQDGPTGPQGEFIPGEGLDVLLKIEGADGRHAGISVAELAASKSGRLFGDFMVDARLRINDSPYGSNYPQGERELDAARILCERVRQGTNTRWDQYRVEMTGLGLPVAYYGSDVLDPDKRRELLTNRDAVLERHGDEDAFEVASSWMDEDIASAIGLTPREEDSGKQLLTQMCVRCHSSDAPRNSKRARFNAEHLDRIEPDTARVIRERIRLPSTSPRLMPPRRSALLTSAAIARIESYIDGHCSDPRPGACE